MTAIKRPKIRPVKRLDLTGPEGQRIVRETTKRLLAAHKNTFAKLADL